MKKARWLTITFILALGSVLYELVLAQSLSAIMGNTTYRYNLTIGLYISAMGLGAFFVDKFSSDNVKTYFVKVEIILSILGALAPWIVLSHDSFLQYLSFHSYIDYFSTIIQMWSSFFNNGLVIVLGVLSGIELPLLMRIGKEQEAESSIEVLSLDYIGTTVGAAIFPLLLFPNLNLFQISYLVSFLNILIACKLAFEFKLNFKIKMVIVFWILIITLVLLNKDEFNQTLSMWFYDKK